MRTHLNLICCGMAVVLAAGAGCLMAADDAGITVSGVGEVKAKPNLVEFELRIAGSAELTGDAIVKYQDAKRRTLDAFNKLKLKNLKIEEQGIGLASAGGPNPQQMVFGPGGQAPAVKAQVEISRTIRLALGDIQNVPEEELMEMIGKILDTAKDAGASVGPSSDTNALVMARMFGQQMSGSMATFVLDTAAELREQAYQQAIEQARTRARRLASLANVKLGSVVSVQEAPVITGDDSSMPQRVMMAMYGIRDSGGKDDLRVTSDRFAEIPVRVNLQVRFSIEK